ncbi:MAG: sugar ABC transporter permease [Anaerolineae bacterium]|nr:sugar ABC transporter permease [Anaerolineae bacterium]
MAVRNVGRSANDNGFRLRINPAILLGIPYILLLITFGIVPMILAVVFSFSKFGAFQPEYLTAGFSNYTAVLSDPQLVVSFGNILRFASVSMPVSFAGALGIALVLNLVDDRLGRAMRTVYFIPGAVTLSAVALIAVFMFDPGVSPFGFIIRLIAPEATTASNLITNKTLVPFLTIVRFFSSAGGWIAIFYGALTGINREIIEAGMIDGCGPWRMAIHIKRPLIMSYVWFMLITLTISNLQLFAEPYILSTAMRTATPIDPYWSPNMWAAFLTTRTGDFGKSGVISFIMLAISLVAAIVIITRTGFFKTDVDRE